MHDRPWQSHIPRLGGGRHGSRERTVRLGSKAGHWPAVRQILPPGSLETTMFNILCGCAASQGHYSSGSATTIAPAATEIHQTLFLIHLYNFTCQ